MGRVFDLKPSKHIYTDGIYRFFTIAKLYSNFFTIKPFRNKF